MIIKNELGLPQAFINALNLERHNAKGCYSATTLIKSACETILTDRHFDEIEIDVSDCVWQIWGTAVHSIFEKSGIEGFTEEKFSVPVSKSTVTGRVDLYDLQNEIVYDWKTANVYKWSYLDFDDWDKQGLIYAWLMKQNGLNVKEIRFVALLKDHSKSKARNDAGYPQKPTMVHTVKVSEEALAEIENFIKTRITDIERSEHLPDEELTPCTEKERWQTENVWAVMKKGQKNAVRGGLCKTEEEANEKLVALKGDYIEFRQGESRKCLDYCNVCSWCPYCKK